MKSPKRPRIFFVGFPTNCSHFKERIGKAAGILAVPFRDSNLLLGRKADLLIFDLSEVLSEKHSLRERQEYFEKYYLHQCKKVLETETARVVAVIISATDNCGSIALLSISKDGVIQRSGFGTYPYFWKNGATERYFKDSNEALEAVADRIVAKTSADSVEKITLCKDYQRIVREIWQKMEGGDKATP